jgi:hypothetical protein
MAENRVVSLRGELRQSAFDASVKYLALTGPHVITPSTPANPAVFLRDSVLYRADSLIYHVDLVKRQFASFEARAYEKKFSGREQELLLSARAALTFLFDDVLFNAMSMLDYCGNLIAFAVEGPDEQKKKWVGVARSANDPATKLWGSPAAQKIRAAHREWVQKFLDLRSKVIHDRSTLGDGRMLTTFEDDALRHRLTFPLAPRTVAHLKFLTKNSEGEADLSDAAEQVAEKAIETARTVIAQLLEDLGGPFQAGRPAAP